MDTNSQTGDKSVKRPSKKILSPEENRRMKLLNNENLKLQMLRDEMVTETLNASTIIKQKSKKWRKLGTQFATPKLQDTVHALWKSFEWACDTKDTLIKELLAQLKIRERIARRKYMGTDDKINDLLEDFYAKTKEIKEHEKSNMNLFTGRTTENALRQRKHDQKVECMKTVYYCNAMATSESYISVLGEFIAQKEEMVSMKTSELEIWLVKKTNRIINIWIDYKNVIENYRSTTNRILKKTTELAVRVNKGESIIQHQKKLVSSMALKAERLGDTVAKGGSLNDITILADLRAERAELHDQQRTLYRKFRVNTENAKTRLKNLACNCNLTITALSNITAKGEKLINLHMKCIKLETLKELAHKRLTARSKWQAKQHDLYTKMANFWQDYNEAEMTYKLVYARKRYYLRKNKELTKYLKSCLNNSLHTLIPRHVLSDDLQNTDFDDVPISYDSFTSL